MTTNTSLTKSVNAAIQFESGPLNEFTDSNTGCRGETDPPTATGRNPAIPLPDRRRLMEIEIFLNNCLNLAQAIESQEMTEAIQLLRAARDEIQRIS